MTHQRILKNRLSVNKVGVGMHGLDGVNQKVQLATSLRGILINAIKTSGCVKINIDKPGEYMMGTTVKSQKTDGWKKFFESIASEVKPNEPSYFVIFRSLGDCLIVTYVPDAGKPKVKMVYASSKEALKDGLLEFDDKMQLEEYNVSSVDDITADSYEAKKNMPKPYSEAEERRMEEDKMEKVEGSSTLARIMAINEGKPLALRDVKGGAAGAAPMRLPGMGAQVDMKALRSSLNPIGRTKVSRNQFQGQKKPSAFKPKPAAAKQIDEVDLLAPTPFAKKKSETPIPEQVLAKAGAALLECETEFDLSPQFDNLEEELEKEVRDSLKDDSPPKSVPAADPKPQPVETPTKKPNFFGRVATGFMRLFGRK